MKQLEKVKGVVQNSTLTYAQEKGTVTVPVDSSSWYAWLDMATAFTFRDDTGSFTAQKKRSSNQRGSQYWYAYRRRHGQLFSSYLGTSSRLSLAHLQNTARQLALRGEPAPATSDSVEITPHHEPESVQCSFLTTKIHIPRLPVHYIARSRLLSLLNQSAESRLTLVSAPAGSGKTTLLAAWARACAVPVAWLSLEAADDDPLRFLVYLMAALTHVDVQLEEQDNTITLLAHGYSWEDVLTRFVNNLTKILTRDTVLILDDYHLITNAPIHDAIRFLIEHAPEQLHLLIGTRVDLPLSLARLRSHGQLTELKEEVLRFSSTELQGFLSEMGLDLPEEARYVVEQQTQGWVVGVQLLTLALRGQTDPTSFLQTRSGTHRFFLEYVSEEILAHLSPEMRAFLLHTSVLERLTGSLCEAVTGLPDGHARLAELYRNNLLIHALDDTETWYGYHPLFAEILRAQLVKQEPELLPELYRRASLWYEQQNWGEQASDYAFLAGDLSRAATLLAEQVPLLIAQGKWARLNRWLKRLSPDQIAASPQLWLASIWMQCSIEKIPHITELIEQQIQSHDQDDLLSQRELQQELALFQAWKALLQDDLPQTISLILETLRIHPGPESSLSRLITIRQRIVLSTAYRASGQLEAAEQVLLEATTSDETDADRLLSLMAKASLAELYEARGQLRKLGRLFAEMLKTLKQLGNSSLPFLALTQARYAALLYEWNRLQEAEEVAQQASDLAQRLDLSTSRASLLSLWVQVRIGLAQGNDERIQHWLERPGCDHIWWQSPHQMTLLEEDTIPVQTIPARLALSSGRLELAECWEHAQEIRFDDPLGLQLSRKSYNDYMTLARILLARGRSRHSTTSLSEALTLLDHLQHAASGPSYAGWLIEIQMLTALVLQAQGKIKQAVTTLGSILAHAEAEGYVRLFADEGQPMALLLSQATTSSTYLQRLLDAVPPTQEAPDRMAPGTTHQQLLDPLSPREQEVLSLLATGLSNQQIAEQLVISLYTVKLHVKHIFARLSVTNRTQAVARARELHQI